MQRNITQIPKPGQSRLRLERAEFVDELVVDQAFALVCRKYRQVRAELGLTKREAA